MYVNQIMSNNFGYIDIILLAMIAGFIILRLRNILGRKTGHEGKAASAFDEKKFAEFKSELKTKPILKDVLEKYKCSEILLGHHKDDIIENVFNNICRAMLCRQIFIKVNPV